MQNRSLVQVFFDSYHYNIFLIIDSTTVSMVSTCQCCAYISAETARIQKTRVPGFPFLSFIYFLRFSLQLADNFV